MLSVAPREEWRRQPELNRHRQLEGLPGSPLPHAAVWSPNTESNRARPGTGRPPLRCGWGNGADPRCRTEPSWSSARLFHRVSVIGIVELLLGVEPSPPGYEPGALPVTHQQQWVMVHGGGVEPPSPGYRPGGLPLDEPWIVVPAVGVEPTWFRLKGGYAAAASRWQ